MSLVRVQIDGYRPQTPKRRLKKFFLGGRKICQPLQSQPEKTGPAEL